jgi:hypothetical protein
MAKSKLRLILALIILITSAVLLVWGFWPLIRESQVLTIPPNELQLPTPGGFLYVSLVV